MSAQVIAHYDSKLKTIVATDASNTGLGVAIFQIQKDRTRRPVYYGIKVFNRSGTKLRRDRKGVIGNGLGMQLARSLFKRITFHSRD